MSALYYTRFFNDPRLLAYWRLEDVLDIKGGYHLTNNNSVTFTTGKFDNCADFSAGSTKSLTRSDQCGLSLDAHRTISTWVKITTDTAGSSNITGEFFFFQVYTATGNGVYYAFRYDRYSNVPYLYAIRSKVNVGDQGVELQVGTLGTTDWHHLALTYDGATLKGYLDGVYKGEIAASGNGNYSFWGEETKLHRSQGNCYWLQDDTAIFSRVLSASEIAEIYVGYGNKSKFTQGKNAGTGTLVKNNDSSLGTDLIAWKKFQTMLMKSVNGGTIFSKEVVSTYSLVNTLGYFGGVLAPNGDIHFIQHTSAVGQKISSAGVVSTYSLVYTNSGGGYVGGVLAPNGDIHFVPLVASVGQKISSSGIVSTYSLVYTNSGGAYLGGVLAANGDIHFVPLLAPVGQKISASGAVSTYSLVYTVNASYAAGILDSNGYTHFIPRNSTVGQKVSSAGVVSTYSLVYTVANAYVGGVLAPNGDIHFVPFNATKGQKISASGLVSTYSLVYTSSDAFAGGVLAPNGDIHFIPYNAVRGQKISVSGVVSTYSLTYTTGNSAFVGGTLSSNGDIHFIPRSAIVGQKISIFPAIPFSQTVCQSPFFNKL